MMNTIDMLNNEVMVTTLDGRSFTGMMVDINSAGNVAWIDINEDWLPVDLTTDRVSLVNPVKEEAKEVKLPYDVKNITAIKAEYKEEMSEQWEDVDYHTVMVYNNDEDGEEVYDCEFSAYDTTGDYMFCVYFGTYYDEKEALKAAKAMRTKLAKYFDIEGAVSVYTC
ncbi:hypothetical protein PPISBEST_300 [Bacillus phage PPIsBest]|uniref:Uncharacterized protein n=1 Tax=Bacillus phage PPIsBest TaxID=2024234 RepID=A0A222Z160_9CAUD|nr:hypothetical protein PPISBEST_1 [Bacillus phage PPIsBest]ASR78239.1 hypothetical protein PPISBEST_300 [Bacillus phage PPIsBest]